MSVNNAGAPKKDKNPFQVDSLEAPPELRNDDSMSSDEQWLGTEKEPARSKQDTQPPRARSLLGHISIGVKDYDRAKIFYSALKPLGLKLVYDSEADGPSSRIRTLGYGPDETQELLNIFEYGDEAHAPGRGCHVAFNAPTRQAVDDFHQHALAFGGTCDGKPGVRSRYGPHYYAAFVISPDGWRLEAVCKH
ncbi:Glyoxalase/Bleomycin resistance protein/Dihydroxybiphenyl dioxygenase [Coniochaeta sp. PMI_546]|nr:Glyoxalase/Bleomycin resistance protein/Dihydroxybiphenyl dioxygenase [Coniochaeta sp. PMI_546]